ncbi:unnamed protein product [Ceutorhynchus assimilis]|uniref:Uncharacterized protein n=1 Tax=Ceutorhynchus assimilis TaxID=467358 RepID=A0A9N9MSW7_9CUCU|nr:unnamed protein product [Ceutorhynchus assimilis]
MPLILNPAHEMTTLNTVVRRCIAAADKLGKHHVILTTDQALYYKLLELKWCSEEMRSRVILRMGGLHVAMNFLKVIGKRPHRNVARKRTNGMKAHKITLQAIWQILAPQIASSLEEHGVDSTEFMHISKEPLQLKCFLQSENNLQLLSEFVEKKSKESPFFEFWWSYMDMILTLLMFTSGIRDEKWNTYRAALTEMLPFIARYNHGNYSRSLTVYICDMNQLPSEVEGEFLN